MEGFFALLLVSIALFVLFVLLIFSVMDIYYSDDIIATSRVSSKPGSRPTLSSSIIYASYFAGLERIADGLV